MRGDPPCLAWQQFFSPELLIHDDNYSSGDDCYHIENDEDYEENEKNPDTVDFQDVKNGHQRLNLAFVANLFNK